MFKLFVTIFGEIVGFHCCVDLRHDVCDSVSEDKREYAY